MKNRRKNKKRILVAILAVILLFTDIPWYLGGDGGIKNVHAAEATNLFSSWPNLSGKTGNATSYSGSIKLYDGSKYKVTANMTITATATNSAIVVNSGTVELYIAKGVTLTVKGGAASGTSGAGAGIELASGCTLKVYGAGSLNATGGDAAGGSTGGQNAKDAYFVKDDNDIWSGSGGSGGAGGGGAGAGIGGKGGSGGGGGGGGSHVYSRTDPSGGTRYNGTDGTGGTAGNAGGSMGTLYVFDTAKVSASGGSGGSGGSTSSLGTDWVNHEDNGAKGHYASDKHSGFSNDYEGAGGGCGGGGGGGGAGGGSGATTINAYNGDGFSQYATGGGGGAGSGYNSGTKGNGTQRSAGSGGERRTGGAGGTGGSAGSGGSGGSIYYSGTATVTGAGSATGTGAGNGSGSSIMSTVTVNAQGGPNENGGSAVAGDEGTKNDAKFGNGSTTLTTYARSGHHMGGITDLPERTGYTLTGFYNAKTGGTQLADSNGTPTENVWSSGTVYAQWRANTYKVTFNLEGIDQITITDNTAGTSATINTAGQTYTMTYDHEYTFEATPGKDAEGKDKSFIAWYGTPTDYNSTDVKYTMMCPAQNITLLAVAMKGVWAADMIKFKMSEFIPETTYKTVTIQTTLDDDGADMGMVTLRKVKADGKIEAEDAYTMSSGDSPGTFVYVRAMDTDTEPQVYRVFVNGEDTGEELGFEQDYNITIPYYSTTINLTIDGEEADLGTVTLVPYDTETGKEIAGDDKIISLNYNDESENYYYYCQKDEGTTQDSTPTTYIVKLNGNDCPGNTDAENLIRFTKQNQLTFAFSSVTITTKLDDTTKYMGEVTLRETVTGEPGDEPTIVTAYTLTGNTGVYRCLPLDAFPNIQTEYMVYVNDADTGVKVSFEEESNTATLNYYSVTYAGNNHTSGEVPDTRLLLKGSEITLPSSGTLVRTGYSFGGWYLNGSESKVYQIGEKVSIDSTKSFKACWKENADSEARWKKTNETEWTYGSLAEAVGVAHLTSTGLDIVLQKSAALLPGAGFTLDANESFTIETSSITLTMPKDEIITNKGSIINHGTITGSGAEIINIGVIDSAGLTVNEVTTRGKLHVSSINNTNGSIHGGIIGSTSIVTAVTNGSISGDIYLSDNSTFKNSIVDTCVYYELKNSVSRDYILTTDTSIEDNTTYYKKTVTYEQVTDPRRPDSSKYYIKDASGNYIENPSPAIEDGYTYYIQVATYEAVETPDESELSEYYVLKDSGGGTLYEVSSDTSSVPGKTYYVKTAGGSYVKVAYPNFTDKTKISVMGGTTIVDTPTEDQLAKNLGGIVTYQDGKLILNCDTIFRSPVSLSGIQMDTGGYGADGLTSPIATVITAYSDAHNTTDYILGDVEGGTIRLTCAATSYDGGEKAKDEQAIVSGQSITMTATPEEGYEFVGWYDGLITDEDGIYIGGSGEALSKEKVFTVNNFTTPRTFYALFKIKTYTVIVRADEGVELTVTRSDSPEAVMIEEATEKTFIMRYGYGLTMQYFLKDEGTDTYSFNGWFERELNSDNTNENNKETPVKSEGSSSILKNQLTIDPILEDKVYLATTTKEGVIHYLLNGGIIKAKDDDDQMQDYTSFDQEITQADVSAGKKGVIEHMPEKDGWEFLYWIDTEGNRYNYAKSSEGDNIETEIKITSANRKSGITLAAVYGVSGSASYWVGGKGYSTLDAAVTATITPGSGVYGETNITFDDTNATNKSRLVSGNLPDGYTLSTALSGVILKVSPGSSLNVGNETGAGNKPANKDNSNTKSWAIGAKIENINIALSGGDNPGKIYIDGQQSTIDKPILLYPGSKVNFVSDANTSNYFLLTLLNESGAVDLTGTLWEDKMIVLGDATDGDDGSSDAKGDEGYGLIFGRVKITNYDNSSTSRVYMANCVYAEIDPVNNTGYYLIAKKFGDAPAALRLPFSDDSVAYYDMQFVMQFATVAQAVADAYSYNNGYPDKAAPNDVYITTPVSNEDIILYGDNPAAPYSTFINFGSQKLTYNPEIRLIPAVYDESGEYNTVISALTADYLQYTLNGNVTVARVSAPSAKYEAATIWVLDNIKMGSKDGNAAKVILEKGCTIRVTDAKKWAANEKFTLSPLDVTLGQVLVECLGNDTLINNFTLTQGLLEEGYVLYYDKAKDGLCLDNLKHVYSVDESIEGKADGQIRNAKAPMEYIAVSDYTEGSNSNVWTAFTGSAADLAAGKYYVRFAQTDTRGASTISEALEVYPGRKLSVLFRESADSGGAVETKYECVWDNQLAVTAPNPKNTKTGYTFKGWRKYGSEDDSVIQAGGALTGIKEDLIYEAVYEIRKLTVTLPPSNDIYEITLSDGTVITQDNCVQEVDYGMGLTFVYRLKDNGNEREDFKAEITVGSNPAPVTLNADGSYTMTNITTNQTVAIGGVTNIAPPDSLTTKAVSAQGATDGIIYGVDEQMEYILASDYDADPENATFTSVAPSADTVTGLGAGRYYVRYKERDATHPASAYVIVEVGDGPETHLDISVLAPIFENGKVGGTQPDYKKISISNNGNAAVTVTGVTLANDHDAAFTLQGSGQVTIPQGQGSIAYSIRPSAGTLQNAGDYSADIEVSYLDANGVTQIKTVSVSFSVKKIDNGGDTSTEQDKAEDGHWLSLDANPLGDIRVDYAEAELSDSGITITLVKEGSDSTTDDEHENYTLALGGSNADSLVLYKNGIMCTDNTDSGVFNLDGDQISDYSIKPVMGLPVGTYQANINVYCGDEALSIPLEFEVKKKQRVLGDDDPIYNLDGSVDEGDTGDQPKGTIEGLDSSKEYEYSDDGGATWHTVEDKDKIENLPPGDYIIRYPETDDEEASDSVIISLYSEATYTLGMQNVAFKKMAYTPGSYQSKVLPIFSSGTADTTIEKIELIENPLDFAITQGDTTIEAGSSNQSWTVRPADGLSPRAAAYEAKVRVTYYIDEAQTKTEYAECSISVTIVKATREAPSEVTGVNESVKGGNDGGVRDLKDGMTYEYSPDGTNWYPLDEDTDLGYGDYYVRYKEDDNYESSAPVIVGIRTGEEPNYTIVIKAPKFSDEVVGYAPVSLGEIVLSSTGNSDSPIKKIVLDNGLPFDLVVLNGAEHNVKVKQGSSLIVKIADDTPLSEVFMVKPKEGLGIGTYTTNVIVFYSDDSSVSDKITFRVVKSKDNNNNNNNNNNNGGNNGNDGNDDGGGSGGGSKSSGQEDTETPIIPIPSPSPTPEIDDGLGEEDGSKNGQKPGGQTKDDGGKDSDKEGSDKEDNKSGAEDNKNGDESERSRDIPDKLKDVVIIIGGEEIPAERIYSDLVDLVIREDSILSDKGWSLEDAIMALADETILNNLMQEILDGKLVKMVNSDVLMDGGLNARFGDTDAAISAVLSPQDMIRLMAGETMRLELKVQILFDAEVSAADKEMLKKSLLKKERIGDYLSIRLFKVWGEEDKEEVMSLRGEVNIQIDTDADLLGLLSKDGASVQRFEDENKTDNMYTFMTGTLGSGVLIYKEQENFSILNLLILILLLLGVIYCFLRKREYFMVHTFDFLAAVILFVLTQRFNEIVLADKYSILFIALLLVIVAYHVVKRRKKNKENQAESAE